MKALVHLCAGCLSSVAAAAETPAADIRDIRDSGALAAQEWLPALLAVALLSAVVVLAVRYWRRRAASTPSLPAHRRALDRLEALHARVHDLGTTAFATAASEVVRQYIEERFGLAVTRRTSEEFLADILASPGSDLLRHRISLQDFLQHCDVAKFAGTAADGESSERIYRGARQFIDESTPAAA